MYLRGYKLIGVSPCLADGAQFRVTALLSDNVSRLMPYLNAALSFCTYEPLGPMLTFKCMGCPVILYPDRIMVGQLREVDQAETVLDALVEFVNLVSEQTERLKPEYTTKDLPQPKEILSLLPQTNCADCGEATCTAFTVKLVKGEKKVEGCPHLLSNQVSRMDTVLETLDQSNILARKLVQV